MTDRVHVSSIQALYCDVDLSRDPTSSTVETAVVAKGSDPDSGDYTAATSYTVALVAEGRWRLSVVSHTIGAAGATQTTPAGKYTAWVHVAKAGWADNLRFPVGDVEVWES